MRKAKSTMNITIAPICKTDANVLEERHRNAVEATRSSKITMIPTKVTIHMVLRFMMNEWLVLLSSLPEVEMTVDAKVNRHSQQLIQRASDLHFSFFPSFLLFAFSEFVSRLCTLFTRFTVWYCTLLLTHLGLSFFLTHTPRYTETGRGRVRLIRLYFFSFFFGWLQEERVFTRKAREISSLLFAVGLLGVQIVSGCSGVQHRGNSMRSRRGREGG